MIIVDSLMGSGKTSFAIQYINEHPELSYVYCTPFLDEVARIKEMCPDAHFKEPTYEDGRKLDSFNRLLENGENIVVTHCTFANANEQTIEFIQNSDYVLIMDETLNTLEDFNSVCSDSDQRVKREDIKMLNDRGFIKVDPYGNVSWICESYQGSKYTDVERFAKNGTLLCLDGIMLVWQFPAHIFDLFKQVFVLTYMFDGSILKPYFMYHNIKWRMASVANANGKYFLTDYTGDTDKIKQCKDLIKIYENDKSNNYRNHALSKSWYNNNKDGLPKLKKNLNNFFRNVSKAKADDILWTCPKKYFADLKGAGYISIRRLTQEEKKLPKSEMEKIEKQLSCFLSCNAKATNAYKDRSVLGYAVNMYLNPSYKKYFERKSKLDGTELEVNEDLYALSCMLQWIWRSRIREGKPISIYIPSVRMRKLLQDWLDLKINLSPTS